LPGNLTARDTVPLFCLASHPIFYAMDTVGIHISRHAAAAYLTEEMMAAMMLHQWNDGLNLVIE